MRAREIHELRRTQRYMIQGLEHEFLFDKDYIKSVACKDEVDQAILDELYTMGPPGKLPRDIALELADYKLNPWNVTQRIRRMNKRLDRHIVKDVAEKRGLKWALTNWAYRKWGATEEEINDNLCARVRSLCKLRYINKAICLWHLERLQDIP